MLLHEETLAPFGEESLQLAAWLSEHLAATLALWPFQHKYPSLLPLPSPPPSLSSPRLETSLSLEEMALDRPPTPEEQSAEELSQPSSLAHLPVSARPSEGDAPQPTPSPTNNDLIHLKKRLQLKEQERQHLAAELRRHLKEQHTKLLHAQQDRATLERAMLLGEKQRLQLLEIANQSQYLAEKLRQLTLEKRQRFSQAFTQLQRAILPLLPKLQETLKLLEQQADPQQEALTQTCRSLLNYLAQWSDYSRCLLEQITLRPSLFSLQEQISLLEAKFSKQLIYKSLDFQWQTEDLPQIEGDRELCRSILSLLMGYAIDQSPLGGTLRLALQYDPSSPKHLSLSLEHPHPSLSQDDLHALLDPFAQARTWTPRLSIALAQELARLHRGSLTVYPEQETLRLHLQLPLSLLAQQTKEITDDDLSVEIAPLLNLPPAWHEPFSSQIQEQEPQSREENKAPSIEMIEIRPPSSPLHSTGGLIDTLHPLAPFPPIPSSPHLKRLSKEDYLSPSLLSSANSAADTKLPPSARLDAPPTLIYLLRSPHLSVEAFQKQLVWLPLAFQAFEQPDELNAAIEQQRPHLLLACVDDPRYTSLLALQARWEQRFVYLPFLETNSAFDEFSLRWHHRQSQRFSAEHLARWLQAIRITRPRQEKQIIVTGTSTLWGETEPLLHFVCGQRYIVHVEADPMRCLHSLHHHPPDLLLVQLEPHDAAWRDFFLELLHSAYLPPTPLLVFAQQSLDESLRSLIQSLRCVLLQPSSPLHL